MPRLAKFTGARSFGGIGSPPGGGGGSNEETFTTPGIQSWTAPAGVTSVNVVAVGAGGRGGAAPASINYGYAGGGGGGGLAYKNNISVTPGQTYTVVVGSGSSTLSSDRDSVFINEGTVAGYGGGDGESRALNESGIKQGGSGGEWNGLGGGNGGDGGDSSGGQYNGPGGGGGAGGYTGVGGAGGNTGQVSHQNAGTSVYYGGGGGAGGPSGGSYAGGGGGVGLDGISGYTGSEGTGGVYANNGSADPVAKGGAGGNDAGTWPAGTGGTYGGGAAGGYYNEGRRSGAHGAVKIIWGVSNPFGHSYQSYTGGEYYSSSAITHGQWRTASTSTTSNTQIWIRQQIIGGNSQNTLAVNLRRGLNNLGVGDTITVGAPFSPTKTFTISGGISTQIGYTGNNNYRSWFFDVDAQSLTNDTYFYEFTIQA